MRKRGGVGKSLQRPSSGTSGGSHSEIFFRVSDEFQRDDRQLSMFGPVCRRPKDLGGRPRWNKVEYYQELVEFMLEIGEDIATIAKAVGVSTPTLRHYFSGLPAWQARRNNRSRSRRQAAQDA